MSLHVEHFEVHAYFQPCLSRHKRSLCTVMLSKAQGTPQLDCADFFKLTHKNERKNLHLSISPVLEETECRVWGDIAPFLMHPFPLSMKGTTAAAGDRG